MNNLSIFGITPQGDPVQCITLRGGGLTAQVLTWGATLQSLHLAGISHSLVLGFPSFAEYLASTAYIGATVGRYANRLARGCAEIAGKTYQLDQNFLGKHLLHGGAAGADKQVWDIQSVAQHAVTLQLRMPDGHMGFPGNLSVSVTYSLPGDQTLAIELQASTDAPTLCNFAHHSYFNLDGSADVRDHRLQVAADHYLPMDAENIPSGEIVSVAGTALDFRQARTVRDGAYDHNLCLSKQREGMRPVGWLRGKNGLLMELATTEPGLQVYDGKWLDGGYGAHAGLALEPQCWPDAPNHPEFPSALLLPGAVYRQQTQFMFR